MEPFTLTENPDGSVDVAFQGGASLSFRSVESFRHVFRKRGLSEIELDLALENHRYIRRGLSYCDDAEKEEFRALAQQVRRHPEVKSWPGFRDLIHLHPSVDPRRLVEDGGTRTHLFTLRREAIKLLGRRHVQSLHEELMRARSQDTAPADDRSAAQHETNESGGTNGARPAVKISLRADLPVLKGKQTPRTATPQGRRETDKLALYLRERYQLDGADIGRMAGLTAGGPAALKKGFPPARLDLLKANIRALFHVDPDADVLQGANDRYHPHTKAAGKDARKRAAAGMPEIAPPAAPLREPTFDELMESGRTHLHSALRDFRAAHSKLRGMMALTMEDLVSKVAAVITEFDGEQPAPEGAQA